MIHPFRFAVKVHFGCLEAFAWKQQISTAWYGLCERIMNKNDPQNVFVHLV